MSENTRLIIIGIILTVLMIIIWIIRRPGLAQYNRYMCANYGYYSDCKTPLRPEDRLK